MSGGNYFSGYGGGGGGYSYGGGGGGYSYGGGGGYGGYGGYGGGGYKFDKEAYERERKAREERERREEEEMLAVDASIEAMADDPAAQLAARRERYACEKDFTQLTDLVPWADECAEAASKGIPIAARGVTARDTGRRFPVNEAINRKVFLFQGDITELEIDAIVNAANSSLLGGGGIDGAIHGAAGPLLVRECRTLGGCSTGQTKMTRGYHLPARHVLHTVGPIGRGDAKMRSCYQTCLDLVSEHRLRSVAFCGIGTGIYSFPLVRAAHIALRTVRLWLEEHHAEVDGVIFCVFTDAENATYEALLPSYFPVEGAPAEEAAPEDMDMVLINAETIAAEEAAERTRYSYSSSSTTSAANDKWLARFYASGAADDDDDAVDGGGDKKKDTTTVATSASAAAGGVAGDYDDDDDDDYDYNDKYDDYEKDDKYRDQYYDDDDEDYRGGKYKNDDKDDDDDDEDDDDDQSSFDRAKSSEQQQQPPHQQKEGNTATTAPAPQPQQEKQGSSSTSLSPAGAAATASAAVSNTGNGGGDAPTTATTATAIAKDAPVLSPPSSTAAAIATTGSEEKDTTTPAPASAS